MNRCSYQAIATLLAFTGCSLVETERPGWAHRMETRQISFSFDASSSVSISAVYRNDSDRDVRLSQCGNADLVLLQKMVSGSFRSVYRPVCQAIVRAPTVVPPGDSVEFVFVAVDDPPTLPEFGSERSGVYRLVSPDAIDEQGRRGTLQSNPFEIKE